MSYIYFTEPPAYAPSRKTKIFYVMSAKHNYKLGTIKWYPQWRQYAFFPVQGTIFNTDCLREITAKIKELMDERKRS